MRKMILKVTIFLMVTVMDAYGAIKCHIWRDIHPCECLVIEPQTRTTSVTCENMSSFAQVIDILQGRFHPNEKINLRLERSNLPDLHYRQFREINVTVKSIRLNHDYLGLLDDDTFMGMSRVTYVSFADTPIEAVPGHLWKYMPNIETADFGRTKIKEILYNSFEDLQSIKTIVLAGNDISRIDRNSIPLQIQRLHLGRNRINNLNGTLIGLRNLSWLFLNANDFEDLEGQLPYEANNLEMIHASENRLIRVPQLSIYPRLETVFLNQNELTTLDGAISGCKSLDRIDLKMNQIHTLTTEDFLECEVLDTLELSHNQITSLNGSLIPLKSLKTLQLQYNLLTEFSFNEIIGLENLRRINLSYNQISNLVGPASNLVEPNIRLTELNLDHNNLETLNGALSGLSELLRLDLSHNKLRRISPDDFINLDELRLLDISHNQLKTLEEMSKTYLPKLAELKATHNQLTVLEHDFHGLPVLCDADLSNNHIVSLGRDLVTKTRCKIEHGIHEGTYDTLKIYLFDNPILCDAALPEINSEMETNHTRVVGVTYCNLNNELPLTPRPNTYLGYIPDQTTPGLPLLPPIYGKSLYDSSVIHQTNQERQETLNQIQPKIHPDLRDSPVEHRRLDQYQTHNINHFEGRETPEVRQTVNDEPVSVTNQQSALINSQEIVPVKNITAPVYGSNSRDEVINKLASDIEFLKTRLEKVSEISVQNGILLNKTILHAKVP